jgi:hypothetical protein
MIGLNEFLWLIELYWYAFFDKAFFHSKYFTYAFYSYEMEYPWGLVSLYWQENFRGLETLSMDEGADLLDFSWKYEILGTGFLFGGAVQLWIFLFCVIYMLPYFAYNIKVKRLQGTWTAAHAFSRYDGLFRTFTFGSRINDVKDIRYTLHEFEEFDVRNPSEKLRSLSTSLAQNVYGIDHQSLRDVKNDFRRLLIGYSNLANYGSSSAQTRKKAAAYQTEGLNKNAFRKLRGLFGSAVSRQFLKFWEYQDKGTGELISTINKDLAKISKHNKSVRRARAFNPLMLRATEPRLDASVPMPYVRGGAVRWVPYRSYFFYPGDYYFQGAHSHLELLWLSMQEPSMKARVAEVGLPIFPKVLQELPPMTTGADLEDYFCEEQDWNLHLHEDPELFEFSYYALEPTEVFVLDYITHAPFSNQPAPLTVYTHPRTKLPDEMLTTPKQPRQNTTPLALDYATNEESVITSSLDLDDVSVFTLLQDIDHTATSWRDPILTGHGLFSYGNATQYARYNFNDFSQYGSFFSENPFFFSSYTSSWRFGVVYPFEYDSLLHVLAQDVLDANTSATIDALLLAASSSKVLRSKKRDVVFNYSANTWVSVSEVSNYAYNLAESLFTSLHTLGGNKVYEPHFPKGYIPLSAFISAVLLACQSGLARLATWLQPYAKYLRYFHNEYYSISRPVHLVLDFFQFRYMLITPSYSFSRGMLAREIPTPQRTELSLYNEGPFFPYWLQYGYTDAPTYFDMLDDYGPDVDNYVLGLHSRKPVDLVGLPIFPKVLQELPPMTTGADLEDYFCEEQDWNLHLHEDPELFEFSYYALEPTEVFVLDYITHAPFSNQPAPLTVYTHPRTKLPDEMLTTPKQPRQNTTPLALDYATNEESVITSSLDLDDVSVFTLLQDIDHTATSWRDPILTGHGLFSYGNATQYARYNFNDFSQYGSFFSENPFFFSSYTSSWRFGVVYPFEYDSLLHVLAQDVLDANTSATIDALLLAASSSKVLRSKKRDVVFNYSANTWVSVSEVSNYAYNLAESLFTSLHTLGGNKVYEPHFPKGYIPLSAFISAVLLACQSGLARLATWLQPYAKYLRYFHNEYYSISRPVHLVLDFFQFRYMLITPSYSFSRGMLAREIPTPQRTELSLYNEGPFFPYWLQYGYTDAPTYFDMLDDYGPDVDNYVLGLHSRKPVDLVVEPPTTPEQYLSLFKATNLREAAAIQRDIATKSFFYSTGSLFQTLLVQRSPADMVTGFAPLDEAAQLLERRRSARVALSVAFPQFYNTLDVFLDVPHKRIQKATNQQEFKRDFMLEVDPTEDARKTARRLREYRRELLKEHLAKYLAGDKSARPGRLERPLMNFAQGKEYIDMRHWGHLRWKRIPERREKLPPWMPASFKPRKKK